MTTEISIQQVIDDKIVENSGDVGHEDPNQRQHLGASVIGKECARAIYYGWRWFTAKKFSGRMLRLFGTGFRYEKRFIAYLELIGVTVSEFDLDAPRERLFYHPESDCYVTLPPGEVREGGDWELCVDVTDDPVHELRAKRDFDVSIAQPKQYRFSEHNGHFGGSMDGKAFGFKPEWTDSRGRSFASFGLTSDTVILLEFKSHNRKSFDKLVASGVASAKPEHVVQMCLYMDRHKLPLALYCAVCKDDDELYFEFVKPVENIARENSGKALRIITATNPPPRIHDFPHYFACKFCDHRMVCHFGDKPQLNCRTCRFSYPADDGKWKCQRWNHAIIPPDAQEKGCQAYMQIHD